MAEENPQWKVWLDQLVRVHAALDKVGSAIFPAGNVDDYIRALLYETLVIHSKIESLESTVELTEATDEAILKVLKAAAYSRKDYKDQTLFDEFDIMVRRHYIEFLKNPEYFVPKHTTWTSEPGKTSTTASLGIGYGKRDGVFVEWYDDGSVKTVGSFKNDDPAGVWVAFNKKGTLLTRYDHDEANKLEEEFKKKTSILESQKEEEAGLGTVILGSLAALTFGSFLGAVRKKKTKIKEVESVKEIHTVKEEA